MSNDKRTDLCLAVIAIAIIAVLVAGEIVVYTSDYTDYSASASIDGDLVSYEISATGSKEYSVVVSDNGSHRQTERLYIYQDDSYKTDYSDVLVAVGARELDQAYYIEQLGPTLRYRGIHDIEILDADALRERLISDAESGQSSTAGLVMLSGAFPSTVYTGSADDPVMKWISSGGSLFWIGNLIGACYATHDALVPVEGYQEHGVRDRGGLLQHAARGSGADNIVRHRVGVHDHRQGLRNRIGDGIGLLPRGCRGRTCLRVHLPRRILPRVLQGHSPVLRVPCA